MTAMRFALAAFLLAWFLGCSTHYTTAMAREDGIPVYQISDNQALEIAHRALVEAFPGRKVTNLEGPTWGYSTTYRMLLDTYSQQILVVPMEGVSADGNLVRGFVFDISGSGSAVISGSSKNRGLFERVRDLADSTGTRVFVKNASRVPFAQIGEAPESDSPSSAERRLREIQILREKGLINEDQFESKQQRILEDL